MTCRKCCNTGHVESECVVDDLFHWKRPLTLEELIPADVRERWNITTSTPIDWSNSKRDEDAKKRELHECNIIRISDTFEDLVQLTKVLKIDHKGKSRADKLAKILEYSTLQGKVVILN